MTSKKPIQLNDAVIQKQGYDTSTGVTKLTCTTAFDQITADSIDVKDALFDEGGVRRNGVSEWTIKKEYFGCTATFTPYQENIWNNKPLVLKLPKVEIDKVLSQDADGRLKMSLKLYVEGFPSVDMAAFIPAVGKNTCALLVERPQTKTEQDHAEAVATNLKLFSVPKEPKPTKEAKGNAAVVPPLKPKEPEAPAENPATDNPEPVENGALASHAVMGEKTRGRRRGQDVQ